VRISFYGYESTGLMIGVKGNFQKILGSIIIHPNKIRLKIIINPMTIISIMSMNLFIISKMVGPTGLEPITNKL